MPPGPFLGERKANPQRGEEQNKMAWWSKKRTEE
jgi:hypothetical protein